MDRNSTLDAAAHAFAAGRLAQAEGAYRAMLAEYPADAEVLSNLAAVLTATQSPEAAEQACRAALAARPGYWAALANLGNALHRQQRHAEAVNAYHASLEADPRNACAWTNLGVALNEQWDMANAMVAHDAALRLSPHNAQIRCNRAMALLMDGDYAQGFREFEWRWRTPGMKPHGMTQPQWRGEDPAGKRILLHAEGGFGDTLQFIRYAPLLEAAAASVTARVQAPLLRLLRRRFPEVVFTADEAVPAHDLHCPLLSLPHAFGTTLESVPHARGYLTACAEAASRWRRRLAALGDGLKIGLVWEGAPLLGQAEFRAMNARRSIPFPTLAPLLDVPGTQLVSVQFGAAQGQSLYDPMPHIGDFDDTAALIAALDLVISVDSAVAHLAGALGKPVWVLSRFDACWRWLAHRRDSPWYDSLRVYRQAQPGSWASVIATVAHDLGDLARSG